MNSTFRQVPCNIKMLYEIARESETFLQKNDTTEYQISYLVTTTLSLLLATHITYHLQSKTT